jgi:hypothetical protein
MLEYAVGIDELASRIRIRSLSDVIGSRVLTALVQSLVLPYHLNISSRTVVFGAVTGTFVDKF